MKDDNRWKILLPVLYLFGGLIFFAQLWVSGEIYERNAENPLGIIHWETLSKYLAIYLSGLAVVIFGCRNLSKKQDKPPIIEEK